MEPNLGDKGLITQNRLTAGLQSAAFSILQRSRTVNRRFSVNRTPVRRAVRLPPPYLYGWTAGGRLTPYFHAYVRAGVGTK